eukprot:TRINITY_DN49903_c0_g1_i1.p1 TRINITY_DN49903_c0_g1~~TRINITY_DN49903_c0_g1_i1.p1  ORF type:complete len:487 (-),score=64.06 TRINITY_DN49903_c0_g1_i1:103-1563(-)
MFKAGYPKYKRQGRMTLIRNVVIFACAVDAADKALLPATFKALSEQMSLGPKELGALSFAQSVAFSVALPLWGSMLRSYSAKDLMVFGCFLWSFVTVLLAFTTNYEMQFLLRLLVGASLAVVNPTGQAMLCDIVPEEERGWAFGILHSASSGLIVLISFGTTSIASVSILGMWGWRWAYLAVAGMSLVAGIAVSRIVPAESNPPKLGSDAPQLSWLADTRRVLSNVGKKPSFAIMVAQGVTGGIPWNGFAFLTFFYQLSGYTDLQAGQIMFLGGLGGIMGSLLGGHLGDFFHGIFPDRGRVMVAQASVVLGTCFFLWFVNIPYSQNSFFLLVTIKFLFHASACWTQAAALRPICGTIFNDSKDRAQVLALWLALEGVISSICGAPLVGILSEFFGYKLEPGVELPKQSLQERQESLEALRRALIGVSVLPWTLCALAWVPMYWTYPRDRAACSSNTTAVTPKRQDYTVVNVGARTVGKSTELERDF